MACPILAPLVQAQTLTTYTGTIRDLSQAVVTSGQVTFTLQPSSDTTISGNARFVPLTITCGINGSGLLKDITLVNPCVVTNNTALTPSGTSYKACIQAYSVTPGSCFNVYALGTTTDITTVVPTPATAPAFTFVDTTANQTVGGNKIFTGNNSSTGTNQFQLTQENSIVNAAMQSGVDIGAKINAGFASCSNVCTVFVPAGAYTFTTTIVYPTLNAGRAALILDPNAILTFNAPVGPVDAIQAIPSSNLNATQSNVYIRGGALFCVGFNCATANGIHIKYFNSGEISNMMTIQNFGTGMLNEGTNTVHVHNMGFYNDTVGILNTDTGYLNGSPVNADVFDHNQFAGDGWGIKETKSGTCGGCTQHLGNVYKENVYETETIGAIWLDDSGAPIIANSYFDAEPHYIQLGDVSNTINGAQLNGNTFITRTVGQASIELVHTSNAVISGNIEISGGTVPTNFVSQTTTTGTVVWVDRQVVSTNIISADPSNDTLVYGSTAFNNSFSVSATGLQFKNLTATTAFTTGAASRTGIGTGVISVPNNVCYSGADAGNSTQVCLAKLNATNNVVIDPAGQGLLVGNGGTGSIQFGSIKFASGNLLASTAAPTIAAAGCGGAAAAISGTPNGTAAFAFSVGTTPTTTCTLTLPTAATAWNCDAFDQTSSAGGGYYIKQTNTTSTTSVVLGFFSTAGAATAPTASDIVRVKCSAY